MKTITGPYYQPECSDCPTVNWEHCPCWPAGNESHSERINADADDHLPQLALWEGA